MAEKKGKKKQDTAYCKEVNAEFRKGTENAFTSGGSAAYQPRDADTKKPGHGSAGKRQAEKGKFQTKKSLTKGRRDGMIARRS